MYVCSRIYEVVYSWQNNLSTFVLAFRQRKYFGLGNFMKQIIKMWLGRNTGHLWNCRKVKRVIRELASFMVALNANSDFITL